MSFYRQWAAAGMLHKIPIVSVVFAGGNEHHVLTPNETDGIVVAYNYFQELDTPENKAFLDRFRASVGANHPYINGIAIGGYTGPIIWAEAVKRREASTGTRSSPRSPIISNGPGRVGKWSWRVALTAPNRTCTSSR